MDPAEPARRGGSVEEAIENGRLMLAHDPAMALVQAHTILRSDRTNARALYLAAAAHDALGERDAARDAARAAFKASGHDPQLGHIARLLADRAFDQARKDIARRLAEVPGDLAATTMLAEVEIATGRADRAEPLLDVVLREAPDFRPAESLRMRMLLAMDRLIELRELLQAVLMKQPRDPTANTLLSRVLADLQEFDAASELSGKVAELEPRNPRNWLSYGEHLRFAGRKREAEAAFRKAQSLDPDFGQAWWHLANMDASSIAPEDEAAMRAALGRVEDTEHRGNLEFALGILLDRRGEHEQAFRHFAAGNRLRREAQPYNPLDLTRSVTRYLETTPAEAIPSRAQPEPSAKVPIFILGMPRSGSTLLERVLGQHSRIEPLGELPLVPHMVERMARDGGEIEKRIASRTDEERRELGERYLRLASERMKTGKGHFVDKLHMNWKFLPLILRMLPSAVVIDIRRDAMDCCWSNMKTLFARGHPAACDQQSLGRFYRDYVRMTDSLRERAPGRIHFLRYESLIDDFEGELTRLFDHIGLAFERACHDFHRSAAPVATASSEQVRQPLNRKGIGAWRPYEPWLGPLKMALGPLAEP